MAKRHLWLSAFVVIGVALTCNLAFAQNGVYPSTARYDDGTSNNVIPYDAGIFNNIAYQQFNAPAEFCAPPISPNWYPTSGLVNPFTVSGLGPHCDGGLANYFNATHTRPSAGTIHWLTDIGPNVFNAIWFQDYLNFNATTVAYPGGFTLNCPSGWSPTRAGPPAGQNPVPITSVAGGFTYLGDTGMPGNDCPAPSYGGLVMSMRTVGGTSQDLLVMDLEYYIVAIGIHVSSIRLWGIGAGGTGFTNSYGYFQALVFQLGLGGCKTYSDLKDEILDATITGNPPSNQTPVSQPGGPYEKNDPGIGGIRNSLWKKCANSEAAFNRGQLGSAGNTLDAMTHEVDAQDGKHLASDSAQDLRNCIGSMKGALGL